MDELFLYDPDKGLFKEILKQSSVMQGRYFIVSSGFNFSTTDLSAVIDRQKYPCVVCAVPRSQLLQPDFVAESFAFQLYFLTRHEHTSAGEIKEVDPLTLTSQHPAFYDWKDMKECAAGFLVTLKKVIRTRMVGERP